MTFFLTRSWRAVLSSLLVLALASTTKDSDGFELGLEIDINLGPIHDCCEEANAAKWRNEIEVADIVCDNHSLPPSTNKLLQRVTNTMTLQKYKLGYSSASTNVTLSFHPFPFCSSFIFNFWTKKNFLFIKK